jgi:hypothetical protein
MASLRTRRSLALGAILICATLLRCAGAGFGLPGRYRPDEEYLLFMALGFHEGDLNPHLFIYPTLYPYGLSLAFGVFRLVGESLGAFGPAGFLPWLPENGYAVLHLVGRLTTGACGVVGVWAVWRLGRVLLGRRGGMIAAAVLAFNFVSVRDSHFMTTDVPVALAATFALEAIVRVARRRRLSDSIHAGVFCGLAVSTKYTAAALVLPLALAHLSRWGGETSSRGGPGPLLKLLAAVLAGALAFSFTSPFVLLDPDGTRRDLYFVGSLAADGPVGMAAGRGLLWVFRLHLIEGMGVVPVLLSGLGLMAALISFRRGHRSALLVVAAFPLLLLAVFSSARWVPVRYAVLMMPALAVLVSNGIRVLAAALLRPGSRAAGEVIVALVACIGPGGRAVALDRLLDQTDTRSIAGDWIRANLSPGDRIAVVNDFFYARPDLPEGPAYALWSDPIVLPPAGSRFVLIDRHPVYFSRTSDARFTELLVGSLRFICFSPWREGQRGAAVFDTTDAFYAPLSGFGAVERPGPELCLFSLREIREPALKTRAPSAIPGSPGRPGATRPELTPRA